MMAQVQNIERAAQPKLSARLGASRNLLERKVAERSAEVPSRAQTLEADFPDDARLEEPVQPVPSSAVQEPAADAVKATLCAAGVLPVTAREPASAAVEGLLAVPAPTVAPAHPASQPWSDDDERAYQTLAARRRAAGGQRPGRKVDGQLITAGSIRANENTAVAVIVGIVAERGGSIGRGALLDAMAAATFPHRSARPTDRGWCQGYVAGALRDGFLAVAHQPAAAQEA